MLSYRMRKLAAKAFIPVPVSEYSINATGDAGSAQG